MSRLHITVEDGELELLRLEPLLEAIRGGNRHVVMSVKDENTNRTETFYPRVVAVSEVEG